MPAYVVSMMSIHDPKTYKKYTDRTPPIVKQYGSCSVTPGEVVLFHAAAGGVGTLAGQWLKSKGMRAIGTAGEPEKCKIAKANGFEEVIDYRSEDVVARVIDLTNGQGVAAVYDSVGKDTIMGSLDCLKTFGTLVNFGQSSGVPDQFRIATTVRSKSHDESAF